MLLKQQEWIGNWESFEKYIYSEENKIQEVWGKVEKSIADNPKMAGMFLNGAKAFWKKACDTITKSNPTRIGGWNISEGNEGIEINWLDEKGQSLGKAEYVVCQQIEKGLEGKENILFEAVGVSNDWTFRYLLAMTPMPERTAKESGGYLSHLHFQYATRKEELFKDNKICNPMWYATMCDGTGTLLEKCNLILGLHRLPSMESLD